jgi:hypothetical protein
MKKFTDPFGDFKCIHCQTIISADPELSGVHNRNHCPYCLWSRHMDLYQAGDRLCACKSAMKPVGLTIKKARKKYGSEKQGELMLVHLCTECGKASINRIAADDVPHTLLELFERSFHLDSATRALLRHNDIQALEPSDTHLVRARLFGWDAEPVQHGWQKDPALVSSWVESFAA